MTVDRLERTRRLVAPLRALMARRLTRRWWQQYESSEPGTPDEEVRDPRLQRLDDGVGDALTRRYEIDLTGSTVPPEELLDAFRRSPDDFSPTAYASFGPHPLVTGARATVRLPGPWNGPVEVVDDEPDRVRLATRPGHMEAGWIDFSVRDGDAPTFVIESTARAGDRAFWVLHDVMDVGRLVQTEMWVHVAEQIATAGGVRPLPRVRVSTIRRDGAG